MLRDGQVRSFPGAKLVIDVRAPGANVIAILAVDYARLFRLCDRIKCGKYMCRWRRRDGDVLDFERNETSESFRVFLQAAYTASWNRQFSHPTWLA
jgi:hypothetical protein